jgi:predicted Zn-dependent protease
MQRQLMLLSVVALTACADIVPPRQAEGFYEYRQISATDTVSFKWLPAQLPVRIWVDAASPLREPLVVAIARWEGAFTFGEFSATLVADSSSADVIVRNTPPASIDFAARRLAAFAPQCTGETTFDFGTAPRTLQLPWRIYVWPASNPNAPGLADCYRITVTHELGHALGIINPNHTGALTGDVMYRDPVFDGISERDRNTVERLYHGPTTLTATPSP